MKHDYAKLSALVRRIKQGDDYAFTRLYELTYQKLYFLCISLLRDQEDAQDALQETYIKILTNIHSLEEDKLFIAWMNKIAYNICLRMLQKNKTKTVDNEFILSISEQKIEACPEEHMMRASRAEFLASMIDTLDSEHRSVLILKYFEDLKVSQIAIVMNIPEGTVKSRLNTARRLLKSAIQKERRSDILFHLFVAFAIRQALVYSAKVSVLQVHAADTVFENVITAADLPNLDFNPQAAALPTKPTLPLSVKSAFLGVCTSAVIAGILYFLPPAFVSITSNSPESAFTNEAITVTAKVNTHLNKLQNFYAISDDSGQILSGTLEEDNIIHFIIHENGSYTLYAVTSNQKETSAQLSISCIDRKSAIIKNYTYTQDSLILYAKDDLSGIDYASIYGITAKGTTILPLEIDERAGKLIFSFPQDDFKLYLRDLAGNESVHRIERFVE